MKKVGTKLRLVSVIAALGTSLFTSGCETLNQQRGREDITVREDTLLLQESNRKLAGRIEALEMESQHLQKQLEQLRAESANMSRSSIQSVDGRLTDLERRVVAVDQSRAKDKQELVDNLSKKMAEIMQRQAYVAAKPAAVSGNKSSSGSKTKGNAAASGYEHTVKSGETLTAIAAAYGVKQDVIMKENNLQKPNQIRVGQKLFIPASN